MERQSNVLPLDAARNEGRFYGKLVRGKGPLNGVQRVGFLLVGSLICSWSIFIVIGAFPRFFGSIGLAPALTSDKSISMVYLPFAAALLFLGLTIIGRAIVPSTRNP